jgi:hypothetical protein
MCLYSRVNCSTIRIPRPAEIMACIRRHRQSLHILALPDYGNPAAAVSGLSRGYEREAGPGDGIDSQAARDVQKRAGTQTADQMRERDSLEPVFDEYEHGTHVAGIAARGNPAVRLVVARFNDSISHLPFQPTPEYAHHMAADFLQMSDYFRTRNVRVVNMSWENDPRNLRHGFPTPAQAPTLRNASGVPPSCTPFGAMASRVPSGALQTRCLCAPRETAIQCRILPGRAGISAPAKPHHGRGRERGREGKRTSPATATRLYCTRMAMRLRALFPVGRESGCPEPPWLRPTSPILPRS